MKAMLKPFETQQLTSPIYWMKSIPNMECLFIWLHSKLGDINDSNLYDVDMLNFYHIDIHVHVLG